MALMFIQCVPPLSGFLPHHGIMFPGAYARGLTSCRPGGLSAGCLVLFRSGGDALKGTVRCPNQRSRRRKPTVKRANQRSRAARWHGRAPEPAGPYARAYGSDDFVSDQVFT